MPLAFTATRESLQESPAEIHCFFDLFYPGPATYNQSARMKAIVGWTSCAQIGLLALLWQNGGEAVLADDVAKLPPAAWLVLPLTNSEVQYPPSSVWGPASTDPKYNMLHAGDRFDIDGKPFR